MIFDLSVRHGNCVVQDEEGRDQPSLEMAVREAIDCACEMMSDAILNGDDILCRSFEITDQSRRMLATVPFADAIQRQA